jgi:ribosomal-protein-alanine N-acetyltransferase
MDDNFELKQLTENNFNTLTDFTDRDDIKKLSLMYGNDLKLNLSTASLLKNIKDPVYAGTNRMYLVLDPGGRAIGIIGLTDIDMIQQRALLYLIMNDDDRKAKRSYGPIKTLLTRAFTEWNMRKITAYVFAEENATITMLKGFGFVIEGTMKEYVWWKNESFDVTIMGVLKNGFHTVDV